MDPQKRIVLAAVSICILAVPTSALPAGYRCGSELSLVLCPNQSNASELADVYSQKLIRAQSHTDPVDQCPPLSLTANGLVESSTSTENGDTGSTVTTTATHFYLGGPCVSDDDCRPLEAYCLPFPEFHGSSSSSSSAAYFSKYLTKAGLPPPTAYVCRCVPPRTARFSISERRWVCRSAEEISNAIRSFSNPDTQAGKLA